MSVKLRLAEFWRIAVDPAMRFSGGYCLAELSRLLVLLIHLVEGDETEYVSVRN